jgi:hypothetical protein
MTEDQIRELLREMRDDPVPADSLARVRMRIEERTAARPTRWRIPAVAGALLTVLALLLWVHRPVAAPVVPPALVTAEVRVADPPLPVAQIKTGRRAKPVSKVALGSTIRIETADPNVVLIIVTDGGAD